MRRIVTGAAGSLATNQLTQPVRIDCLWFGCGVVQGRCHRGAAPSRCNPLRRAQLHRSLYDKAAITDAGDLGEPQVAWGAIRNSLRTLRHDLRNPLGQIIGYAEMLEEDLREREVIELLPDVAHIAAAAQSLLSVVEGPLLDGGPSLPMPSEIDHGPGIATTPISRVPSSGRILVVDDQPSNRSLLHRRLSRINFEVSEASGGAEALSMVDTEPFDLVMDGLETLDAIRKTHSLSELPVVMATARTGRQDLLVALSHGANDYVTKPFDFAVVQARIATQLELRAATSEIELLARSLEIGTAFLRRTFGRYLSEDVAASLLEREDGPEIAGERRRVTVMMADVRGFTSLTEQLGPRDIVAILNSYFGTMSEVIGQHGGTVDELIGDGILALFGAFESQGNDSEQGVACAVAMQRSLRSVNESNHRRDLPSIEMGIGISTGDVVVGNVGSERRSKFTAIGSAVNLAARIEGFAKGGEILISPATYEDVSELVETDMVRELQPKGFAGSISARSVTAMREGQGI